MRIRIDGKKIPECPICGHELPMKDIQFNHDTGEQWAVVDACTDPKCRMISHESSQRLNPKYFFMGAAR